MPSSSGPAPHLLAPAGRGSRLCQQRFGTGSAPRRPSFGLFLWQWILITLSVWTAMAPGTWAGSCSTLLANAGGFWPHSLPPCVEISCGRHGACLATSSPLAPPSQVSSLGHCARGPACSLAGPAAEQCAPAAVALSPLSLKLQSKPLSIQEPSSACCPGGLLARLGLSQGPVGCCGVSSIWPSCVTI